MHDYYFNIALPRIPVRFGEDRNNAREGGVILDLSHPNNYVTQAFVKKMYRNTITINDEQPPYHNGVRMKVSFYSGGRVLSVANQPLPDVEDSLFYCSIDWWESCVLKIHYQESEEGHIHTTLSDSVRHMLVHRNPWPLPDIRYEKPRQLM